MNDKKRHTAILQHAKTIVIGFKKSYWKLIDLQITFTRVANFRRFEC